MKKALSLFLAVGLLLSLCAFASADNVVSEDHFNWRSAFLNKRTNTIVVTDKTGSQYLVDSSGTRISGDYEAMNAKNEVFQVYTENGYGIVDGRTGKELVPCRYDHTDNINYSNKWLAGYHFIPVEPSGTYDFHSFDGDYYLVDSTDIFYNGVKVGVLPREKFSPSAYIYTHGAYLFVKMPGENVYTVYDSMFNTTTSEYSQEYSQKGTAITHSGSGQLAFDPGCTLTEDEVEQCVYEISNFYYDLHGSCLFIAPAPYERARIVENRFAVVSLDNSHEGVIDLRGNVIIPAECEDIDYYNGLFHGGYQAVKKDGKIGFYDLSGNLTCPFVYSYDSAKVRGPFAELTDLSGDKIVLSGAVGELPMRFSEVDLSYDSSATCFAAKKNSGEIGVMDIYGNELIPFGSAFKSYYDLEVSYDGSVILGKLESGHYVVYNVAGSTAPAQAPLEVEAVPAADDASWICPACGRSDNTGKFCPECGTSRPTQQICSSCGYTVPEGQTAKFCPECGTQF